LDEIEKELHDLAKKTTNAANVVVAAILSIAQDSVKYVKEMFQRIDPEKATLVVAYDVQGALLGASSGAALGTAIIGIGTVPGAVLGALIGASANSVIGALKDAEKKMPSENKT
jgi:uncharacterized membrane protein